MAQRLTIPENIMNQLPQPEFWTWLKGFVHLPLTEAEADDIIGWDNDQSDFEQRSNEVEDFFSEVLIASYRVETGVKSER